MKLHLTYVNRTPRTSAGGKPYTSMSIKAQEYGDKYLSGFGNKSNEGWMAGQEVEVAEVKEVVKGDKTYLNFEMPKSVANAEMSKKFEDIMGGLTVLKLGMSELLEWKRLQTGESKPKIAGTDILYPTAEDEGIDLDMEWNSLDEPTD